MFESELFVFSSVKPFLSAMVNIMITGTVAGVGNVVNNNNNNNNNNNKYVGRKQAVKMSRLVVYRVTTLFNRGKISLFFM